MANNDAAVSWKVMPASYNDAQGTLQHVRECITHPHRDIRLCFRKPVLIVISLLCINAMVDIWIGGGTTNIMCVVHAYRYGYAHAHARTTHTAAEAVALMMT